MNVQKKLNSAFFLHKQRRSAFKVREFRKRTCGRLKKPAGRKSFALDAPAPWWKGCERGQREARRRPRRKTAVCRRNKLMAIIAAFSRKALGGWRPSESGPWKRGFLEEWSVWGRSAAERNLCADKIFLLRIFLGRKPFEYKESFYIKSLPLCAKGLKYAKFFLRKNLFSKPRFLLASSHHGIGIFSMGIFLSL